MKEESGSPLREVALLFLKLGLIGFGGPAAHIALMRREVVEERRWLSDARFLDLLGISNLIPGPNSTEMAIHLGYARAGWRGLLLGGTLFILPAFFIVLALAVLYVETGDTPAGDALLYGIKPVVIAVILQALLGLSRSACRDRITVAAAGGALGLYLIGGNPLYILFGVGLAAMLTRAGPRLLREGASLAALLPIVKGAAGPVGLTAAVASFSYSTLFLTFLKIGATIYGSGYVLLAYMRADFVERLHWLTDQQLIDAVAIGQITPGPVFTTATFVGYLVGGWQGAVVATVAIFLPSFVFVALVYPLVPRLRRSSLMSAFLDGVNAAAVGLMAGVTIELGRAAFTDALTVVLGIAAGVALLRWRLNSALLIAGGAAAGLLHYAFTP